MSTIVPAQSTITNTVVRFEVFITDLVLNTSASFKVWLYDALDKLVEVKYVSMIGQDYLNWGNDDKYVLQFVASQLGFTLA
jgi:hypothetical protein